MTYRKKLLLKRLLIVLGIVAAVLAVVMIIGFTYLGRYVVYTEDGAHFSFHAQSSLEQPGGTTPVVLDQMELIMGASVSAEELLGDDNTNIPDSDVQGVLVD